MLLKIKENNKYIELQENNRICSLKGVELKQMQLP